MDILIIFNPIFMSLEKFDPQDPIYGAFMLTEIFDLALEDVLKMLADEGYSPFIIAPIRSTEFSEETVR